MGRAAAALSATAAVALVSCGGQAPVPVPEEFVALAIVDSIGIELGDSNYVFGSIMSLEEGPDGLVYVLDRACGRVMVYSPDGSFLRQIGSQGSGPGEMMNPLAMAVLGDGRITVCAAYNGGMYVYTPEGEWQGLSAEFTNNPPMLMEGADSNAYVALKLDVDVDDSGSLYMRVRIGRYEEGTEPVTSYHDQTMPFDPTDLTGLMRESYLGWVFGASRDGLVAIAHRSSSEYRVQVMQRDGTPLVTLEREPEQVPKTEDEVADEKAFIEGLLQSMGAQGVVISYEPDPMREQVFGAGFDGSGRVWVQRGTTDLPTFDVWNLEGELLFTAQVESPGSDLWFWDVECGSETMYAYSMDPQAYQKVYVIPLPE